MEYYRLFIHFFIFSALTCFNYHKVYGKTSAHGINSIKNIKKPTILEPSIVENTFYNIYYETSDNVYVSIKFFNGTIESVDLLKNLGNRYVNIYNNKNSVETPSHVFNLISKISNDDDKFFQSSLDEEHLQSCPWILDGIYDENNQIIYYSRNLRLNNKNKTSIVFKKIHQSKVYYRTYNIDNKGIVVEEKGDFSHHHFTIKNSLDDLNKLYINNNNLDGGQYNVQYLPKKKNKFLLVNAHRGEVALDKLNFLIESNHPAKNSFFTLWENQKTFMMVQPVDNDSCFNKSIFLNKKNHHWVLQYHNTGIKNESRKLLIVYDMKKLDQIKQYDNYMINYIFPKNTFDSIKIWSINQIKQLVKFCSNCNKVLILLLLMVVLRIIILLMAAWIRRRFNIVAKPSLFGFGAGETDTTTMLINFALMFLDFSPLIFFNIINNNSSVFVMEPFLWVNDFSWEDQVAWGWRFFTFSPLPFLTAASLFLNNENQQNKSLMGNRSYYVVNGIFIGLFGCIFRYVFTPVNCSYFIIQNVLNYVYKTYFTNNSNAFRRS